jgi:hypothetical protein
MLSIHDEASRMLHFEEILQLECLRRKEEAEQQQQEPQPVGSEEILPQTWLPPGVL